MGAKCFYILCVLSFSYLLNSMEGSTSFNNRVVAIITVPSKKTLQEYDWSFLSQVHYSKTIDGKKIENTEHIEYLKKDFTEIINFLSPQLHWDRIYEICDFIKKFPNYVYVTSVEVTKNQEFFGGYLNRAPYNRRRLVIHWDAIDKQERLEKLTENQDIFLENQLQKHAAIVDINTGSWPSLTQKGKKALTWTGIATTTLCFGLLIRKYGIIPKPAKKQ